MADSTTEQKIFDELYSQVNGFDISMKARNAKGITSKSFTYGEISFETFSQILAEAGLQSHHTFYDLGCGTGKPVFVATLASRPKKAVGIELLPELVTVAEALSKTFQTIRARYDVSIPTEISFLCADILVYDWSEADVVYCASTCFDMEFMQELAKKASLLKPGSRVITLTKELNSPHLKLVKRTMYEMSWGDTTVHFYERI